VHHHRLPFPQTPQDLPQIKYDVKKSLRVPLTDYEQQIEDALPTARTASKSKQIAAVRKAAAQALQSMRGGRRAGAGRKSRPHVRTTLLLAPEVREKLERLADRHGSMSLAAEAAIRHAKVA
jgi:hypothetical protein